MKKLIGVAAILFTLLISIIYRQLTARPAKDRPIKACTRANDCVRTGMRGGILMSSCSSSKRVRIFKPSKSIAMPNIGKKILSVFVDNVDGQPKKNRRETSSSQTPPGDTHPPDRPGNSFPPGNSARDRPGNADRPGNPDPPDDRRFAAHFDKLFTDANVPGPDYYEFARMIVAMQVIADERARYVAAFAGLQAQGLDKDKLLSTAGDYLRVLGDDADAFQKTVDAALQEKVQNKTAETEEKNRRIQTLSQEILELQTQIGAMQKEIRENQEKLEGSRTAYTAESERRRRQIQTDIEKINHYLQ